MCHPRPSLPVGSFGISNLSVQAFILGFNHNSGKEGANRIHFQIGKISGKMVALCDNNYGSGVSGDGYFHMNSSNTKIVMVLVSPTAQ